MEKNSYSLILAELRANRGMHLKELIHVLPAAYEAMDYDPSYLVLDYLVNLMRWGLIEAFNEGRFYSAEDLKYASRWDWPENLEFFISKQAVDIERALGVSLSTSSSAIFNESRLSDDHFPDILILMPFAEDLRPIYDDHIKNVTKDLPLKVGRADDLFSNGSVMADVWSAIKKAKILIADCTGRNPNVFYEIGIAHTLSKETILIAQNIDDIPFDLRHLRVIIYQYNPRGMKAFEDTLSKTIQVLLSRR
ncbi:hypothetical protein [Runella sp.]|uniref:hypothetical protein n=1 Tax=Runella sp. TaxID=1960881 RepID=UPI003D11C269